MASLKDVTRYTTGPFAPLAPVVYEMPAARPRVRNVFDAFFRRWRPIAVLCGLFTLIFLAYLVLTPRRYSAEMTLLVKSNHTGVVNQDNGASHVPPSDVSDAEIATEVELLASRELAGKVVDAMGAGGNQPVTRSKAITKMLNDLVVTRLLKSNMIQVSYRSADAATSARVLELLSSAYLEKRRELHSNSSTGTFLEDQSAQAADALKVAQSKLLQSQQHSGGVSASAQRDLYLQKLLTLEAGIHQSEAELRDAEQRVAFLVPRITTLRARNTAISTEGANEIDPVRQTLEGELDRARTSAAGLSGRIEAMLAQQTEYRERLDHVESLMPIEQELARGVKVAEENYLLYTRKREESRISAQIENQNVANVIVADPPRTPALPEERLSTAAIVTYLFGIVVCALVAFAVAQMPRIVFTPWEVESNASLPVLGTVPAFRNGRLKPIMPQTTQRR